MKEKKAMNPMNPMMNPMLYIQVWRFVNIGLFFHLWLLTESSARAASFVLILLLLVMTSLRWRFRMPLWTVVIDIAVCLLYAPLVEISIYGLALPIFELALKGRWVFALLPIASLPFIPEASGFVFWYFLQAFFFGSFSCITLANQARYRRDADEHRKARYELERANIELLEANVSASQHAELMERHRISRELHDHLGHDLTGASLALQAYEHVKNPEEAEQLLAEVKERVGRSMNNLRETVHNMTPTTLIGAERLERIARHFTNVDIAFHRSGNSLLVPAHTWGLLEACLKEALTNVARHSNATHVEVGLQVTESIVRLSVQDNGTMKSENPPGSGLRSLRMRSRSMGGSLSFSRTDQGFLLVCVIPLEKEAGE